MRMGSLFTGIGGLDLGLLQAGLGEFLWMCEANPFCRKVLAKHFPDIPCFEDVSAVWSPPPVDLICGGFPCQDISAAGKGAGLEGTRSGLWYEFERIISLVEPHCVIVENVFSGFRRWLVPVRQALHMLRYDTAALLLGADDVGAPHERKRVFVVAVRTPNQLGRPTLGDAYHEGLQGRRLSTGDDANEWDAGAAGLSSSRGSTRSAEPGVDRGLDGVPCGVDGPLGWPARRDQEPFWWEPPRTVVAKTVPNRKARLASLGNAVVPAVAYEVGRWLQTVLSVEHYSLPQASGLPAL